MNNRPNKNFKQQKPKTKVRMNANSYEKEFETFEEMIEELKSLHPTFVEIFEETETDSFGIMSSVLQYFAVNAPDVIERNNLPVNISVSANRVVLKTAKFFSFEYSFKYDKEGNITDLLSTVTTFTRDENPAELDEMIVKLVEGWSVKENNFNKR